MTLVTLCDVGVAYDGYDALRHVNLQIDDRDFLGIIGPNGGGKTSLVKAILGTVPYSGSIKLAPELFRGRERLIGYMPQITNFDRAFPISVFEVVLSGLQGHHGFRTPYNRKDRNRALKLIENAGIAEVAQKPIGEISGGQMQRVFLCRAIISSPRVLILDEPSTYVDAKFEQEFYSLLHDLNQRMSIVMVSHDLGTICSYVKTIACVNRTLHYHDSNLITPEQLQLYNCPIELLTHGTVPHRVLLKHEPKA